MDSSDHDELFAASFLDEQLGYFARALEGYRRLLEARPDHVHAAARLLSLTRDMRTDRPSGLRLVWQVPPGPESWESDWVRYLLAGLNCAEVVDGGHEQFHDGSIIVDSRLDASKRNYYFELLKRGCRFALFHLSDELYADDGFSYLCADVVIRNYWCRAHMWDRKVTTVPLGLMKGFEVNVRKAARDRRYVWSFAGNVEKSSRPAMVSVMATVAGGYLHPSDSIGSRTIGARPAARAPLAIADYAGLMSETIFAPCPGGWRNLDSFRVCEALEAGCIPIVERRPSYDYFAHLFGDHPMIVIDSWSNVPRVIADLRSDEQAVESRRRACETWWQDHKRETARRVQDAIRRQLA